MNILFVHSTDLADQHQVYWRCRNIARAIERTGRHHAALVDIPSFVAFSDRSQRLCKAANLIVIHRYNVGPVLQATQYWKSQGRKLVLDMDEAVDLMPEEMESYNRWHNGEFPPNFFLPGNSVTRLEPLPLPQLTWSMAQMDAVTVPSLRLAGDLEKYGRVWEIPDYIHIDRYMPLKPDHGDKIYIGMNADGVSIPTIVQGGLLGALEEISRMRSKVRFFLANVPAALPDQISTVNIKKSINFSISPDEWARSLLKLDIGLGPVYTDYDLRYSRSRVIEYLATRIPWIASDRLPYRDFRDYGMLVENSQEAWRAGLLTIIDSIDVYRKRAEAKPYLFAVSQDIDENIGKILEVYEQIFTSK